MLALTKKSRSGILALISTLSGERVTLLSLPDGVRHVLDGDHGLVGERRRQLDLPVSERPYRGTRQREHADRSSFECDAGTPWSARSRRRASRSTLHIDDAAPHIPRRRNR